ncbi:MAG: PqqD family protein [Deltaproteobacteria bacterium]|nr:PqqD family protein [Deltaproteobacteria bacterium]
MGKNNGISPRLSRDRALSAVVEKNREVEEEPREKGIILTYQVVYKPWFARLARRMGLAGDQARTKRLELDAMGRAVWDMVDGRRTVKNIVDKFERDFQVLPAEAEASVTVFLRELGKRGLVGMREK